MLLQPSPLHSRPCTWRIFARLSRCSAESSPLEYEDRPEAASGVPPAGIEASLSEVLGPSLFWEAAEERPWRA